MPKKRIIEGLEAITKTSVTGNRRRTFAVQKISPKAVLVVSESKLDMKDIVTSPKLEEMLTSDEWRSLVSDCGAMCRNFL